MPSPTPTRYILLDGAAAANAVSSALFNLPSEKTIDVGVVGTGNVSATVVIEVRNLPIGIAGLEDAGWTTLQTFTLSGSGGKADGIYSSAAWHALRARITAVSGTNAKVYSSVSA